MTGPLNHVVALELLHSPKAGARALDQTVGPKYSEADVQEIVRERTGWLLFFFGGLMVAAAVVEVFEEVLKHHVELSYFVPLLIGHGGNTGSQSNATVIRAMALGQLRPSDWPQVVRKEAAAGALVGALLGVLILASSAVWSGLPFMVALTVAASLPLVSALANILGGVLPLAAAHLGHNPAVTSAPLMTTIVDAMGLAIYLGIGKYLLGI